MKNFIWILVFAILSSPLFAQNWELFSPPGQVFLDIHFFENDIGCAGFSYNEFYLSENIEDPSWQFIDIPAIGAACFNQDTILILINGGSYSDGLYFLDVNTHEYAVVKYLENPGFIIKESFETHYFVGHENGLIESFDGRMWNSVDQFSGMKCIDMASIPPDVFALASDDAENNVYMSYDDGTVWEQMTFPAKFFEIEFQGYYGMLNTLTGVCNGIQGGLYELNGNTWNLLYSSLAIQALGKDNSQAPYIGWFTGMPPDVGVARFKMNPPTSGIMYFTEGLPNTDIISIAESPPLASVSNSIYCCTDEGAYVRSEIGVGVEEDEERFFNADVYPNPIKAILFVSIPEQYAEGSSFHILNMSGKSILHRVIANGESQFDLQDLAAGLYIATIHDKTGVIRYSRKIIKH